MANLSNINNKFIVTDGGNGRVLIGATNDIGATLFANHPSTTAPSLTFNAPAGQVFENEDLQIAFGLNNASPYNGYMQTRFVSAPYYRNLAINPLGGNVGIGTNSPGTTLDVAGNVSLANYAGTAENKTILAQNSYGQVASGIRSGVPYFGSISPLNLDIYTGNSSKIRIENSTGNVGIGDTSPQGKLEVSQNMSNGAASAFTSPHLRLSALNTTDSTGFVGMTFATSSANNYGFSWGALRTVSALGGMHLRYHANSSVGTDIFNIDYTGNVTIASTRYIRSDSSGGYLTIQGGATFPGGRIDMYGGSSASAGIEFMTGGATGSPTLRLRIDGDTDDSYFTGNLGIGTTLPGSKLTVNGQVQVGPDAARRYALQPSEWGYSSSYRTLILGSASTTYNANDTGSVTLAFGVDVSGNGSGSFTGDGRELLFRNGAKFTTPNTGNDGYHSDIIVLKDGKVGIGTASPDAKLQIQGNIKGGSASSASWTDAKDDIGGLDVFVGSGSNAFTVWDDNAQTAARFIVSRAGNVGVGGAAGVKFEVYGGSLRVRGSSANLIELSNTNGNTRAALGNYGNEGDLSLYRSNNVKNIYLSSYYDSYINPGGGSLFIGGTTNLGYNSHNIQKSAASSYALIVRNSDTSTTNGSVMQFNRAETTATTGGYCTIYRQGDTATGTNRWIVYANGNITNTNNSYGSLSDERKKENIVDATPKLDKLMEVKVRNFNLIGEETKQIGVVAQELEEVFPGMISESKDPDSKDETLYKSVKYSVFVPMLIKAIQELKSDNDSLKARIETLENN